MRTHRIALGLLCGTAFFAPAADSLAADTTAPQATPDRVSARAQVLTVGTGNEGRMDGEMKRRYPGFEQSTAAAVGDHLVVVTMKATVRDEKLGTYGPVQLACSSWQLQTNGPPKLVADLVQITNYPGQGRGRQANHPKIATDGKYVVLGYGSDYNDDQPNTYVMVLNKECQALTQPQMVSVPRNANDGAFVLIPDPMGATGGTVNLITAKPTRELSGYANATVGNYSLKKFEGAIAGPLSERVLGRIALMGVDRNGYAKNLATGKDFLDERRWATRAHLQFDVTDDVRFLLTGEYTKQNDRSGHLTFLDTIYGTPHTVIPPSSFSDPKSRDGAFSREPKMERETWSITGTLDWKFTDAFSLRSITNYRKLDFFNGSDLDVSAYSFVDVDLPMKDKQFSEELQLIYDTERLHALLGAYYYKEKMSGTTDVYLRFANSTLFQFVGENNTEALSPFWNATYDFNDRFSLRAGGRLNNEDRDFQNFRYLAGNLTGQLADQRDFDKYVGEYGLDFHMTPDAMVYYTFSQGFRSGATLIMQIDSKIIAPTTVDNHEIGIKFQTPDHRFTANIAAYTAKVKNLQRSQATAILDANGNAIGAALRVNNINDMKVKGFEVELGWTPVDRLRLGATIVHVDAKFKDFLTDDPFIPGNAFVQVAGNTPALSPKWRTHLHAEYGFLLGNGATVTPGVDWNSISKQYFDEFNRDSFGEGSYSLLDASLAYRARDNRWSVTLWGKNLTGEKKLYDANFSVFGQIRNKMMIAPMTWGATASYRF